MSWELYWRFRISPLGFLVAWERGFSAQTFWNQRKRVNKQLKGADSSLKRIGSRVFLFDFSYKSQPRISPTHPSRVRLGMYQKSNQPWPSAEGHGLGSISYGDYDFQRGVLSSRCFGWTFGPFHQRPRPLNRRWTVKSGGFFCWIKKTTRWWFFCWDGLMWRKFMKIAFLGTEVKTHLEFRWGEKLKIFCWWGQQMVAEFVTELEPFSMSLVVRRWNSRSGVLKRT